MHKATQESVTRGNHYTLLYTGVSCNLLRHKAASSTHQGLLAPSSPAPGPTHSPPPLAAAGADHLSALPLTVSQPLLPPSPAGTHPGPGGTGRRPPGGRGCGAQWPAHHLHVHATVSEHMRTLLSGQHRSTAAPPNPAVSPLNMKGVVDHPSSNTGVHSPLLSLPPSPRREQGGSLTHQGHTPGLTLRCPAQCGVCPGSGLQR
jgi:hypothetical protein